MRNELYNGQGTGLTRALVKLDILCHQIPPHILQIPPTRCQDLSNLTGAVGRKTLGYSVDLRYEEIGEP